jgi:hypothetical protein
MPGVNNVGVGASRYDSVHFGSALGHLKCESQGASCQDRYSGSDWSFNLAEKRGGRSVGAD